jgi:hypothetical protein
MIETPALITAYGLAADIIGFAIITWDVLPEYQLYRRKAESDEYHGSVLYAAREVKDPEPVRRAAQGAISRMAVGNLQALRRKLRLSKLPIENEHGEIDASAVERSKVEVEAAIASQRAKLDQRTRPPLMVGVSLIFLGFIGQLLGTLWGAYSRG